MFSFCHNGEVCTCAEGVAAHDSSVDPWRIWEEEEEEEEEGEEGRGQGSEGGRGHVTS